MRTSAPAACAMTCLLLAACEAGGDPGTTGGTAAGDGGSSAAQDSGGGRPGGEGGEDGSGDGGAGASSTGTASSTAAATGVTVAASSNAATSSSATGGPVEPEAEVYAHSAGTLYRLDLGTNAITTIGVFPGCGGEVIDIALDEDSNMFGTTFTGLYRIDRLTSACTLVANGTFPNSLSFVPRGTLAPDVEALVGYVDADYVRIDTTTGQMTTIGNDVLPPGLVSSGDIVSVIDGPTLLTVTGGSACFSSDCVLEIDPVTGASIRNVGSTGQSGVFGVAYWDGKLFGFSTYGDVFEFFDNGAGITTNAIAFPASPAFYGAGSTTAAPPGIFN